MKNGYIAFWNGKRKEVYANTSYDAQQEATKLFQATAGRKKVKSYEVNVTLAEQNGAEVKHIPMF